MDYLTFMMFAAMRKLEIVYTHRISNEYLIAHNVQTAVEHLT